MKNGEKKSEIEIKIMCYITNNNFAHAEHMMRYLFLRDQHQWKM